ncbi:MAG: adenylyltransferase/cytidyltransferase family protein [Phycisphaerae bacterium]
MQGLIVGKFMPPHAGHLYLIDRARRCVDELVVILLSLPGEPIAAKLRLQWLDELIGRDVRLEHVEGYPTDYSDPGVWDKWVAVVRSVLPEGPEWVFSSEQYGRQLADLLGARHRMIDEDRQAVPISASQIRHDPMGSWQYIPAPVRPWFVRRVEILGPPGGSRVQLASRLARQFDTVFCPDVIAGSLVQPGRTDWRMLLPLASQQRKVEADLARRANRVLFREGGLVQLKLWAVHQFGRWPEGLDSQQLRQGCDLVILDRRGRWPDWLCDLACQDAAGDEAWQAERIALDSADDLRAVTRRIEQLIRPAE